MISLIFPTYNEIGNLPLLIKEVNKVTTNTNYRFELIFVDDCSTDNTFDFLQQISQKDNRLKVISFARNFGSHAAITAGLSFCKGEAAIVLSSDLQDPPNVIPKLLGEWKKGYQIIWGIRKDRLGEKKSTKFFSKLYYLMINWLTEVRVPPQGADIFLADKKVIKAFNLVPEKHSSVFMVLSWLGFSQTSIYYQKKQRPRGRSKWTLFKKVKLTLDSILSFSDVPIRYASIIGIITATIGFIYASYTTYTYLYNSNPLEGWSVVLIFFLIIGGVQITILGILGEYIWRTFDESRRRPRYIIETTINLSNNRQNEK